MKARKKMSIVITALSSMAPLIIPKVSSVEVGFIAHVVRKGLKSMYAQKLTCTSMCFLSLMLLSLSYPKDTGAAVKKGREFQVNTYTQDDQSFASVSSLSNGSFVVTWRCLWQGGPWASAIYGQLFDSSGTKVGGEFQVSSDTSWGQDSPCVAGKFGGGFVVVWEYSENIRCQLFDSMARKTGSEFQVNTYTVGSQRKPVVTGLQGFAGSSSPQSFQFITFGFVVLWESEGQDGSGWGVYGQLFDSSGTKVGIEFQVNTSTDGNQFFLSTAALSYGFVVLWEDQPTSRVYGQLFDNAANKIGNEFLVGSGHEPSVRAFWDGGFVVTWQSGYDVDIYGQLFDDSAKKVGNAFLVNTHTEESQGYPSVAVLLDEGFVTTWYSMLQDGSSTGVYGQVFDRKGRKIGREFQVNTYTDGMQIPQRDRSVAGLFGDGFVVIWDSENQDGNGFGVYGQMFGLQLPMPPWLLFDD